MKKLFSTVIVVAIMTGGTWGQASRDAEELTQLLKDFLAGASRNDAEMHDRFWAEDLIYTSSSGQRRGKAEIMQSVRSAPPPAPDDPMTLYAAEDIRIQQYGDVAVVAFRLTASTEKDGTTARMEFLNSGTFLKRDGQWRVVNWQATRIPSSEK